MRDATLMNELEGLNKKVALNYKQAAFMNARMQAFEIVLQTSAIWVRVKFILRPEKFWQLVNSVQLELMKDHDEAVLKERKERQSKIQLAPAEVANAVK